MGKHQRNGVERQGKATTTSQRNGAHAPSPRHPPAPPQSRAKMTPVHRGSSAHADGGAAEVKKRFSLAARHRFFWQDKRNGVEWQDKPSPPTQRNGAHAPSKKIKGGTPGEGSPLDPLLRFIKHKRIPRSAERGQGRCPCTRPPLKRRAKLSDALRAALSVYWTCARCAGNRRLLSARRGSRGGRR